MSVSLKPLGQIFRPKPTEPQTTPSLREALEKPLETIDDYKITPSLCALLKEVLDTAVHRKGQGYWIRAEHGAGKTHFIAALTVLLTNHDASVWSALHDESLRAEYQAPMGKLKLFPVTFSLLGTGEKDARDSLVDRFEREFRDALPKDLRAKMPVLSEELAVAWFENQAGELIKSAIAAHFSKVHHTTPQEYRSKEGTRRLGAEILKVAAQEQFAVDLKGSFRERFGYLYDRITQLGGYDGLLFVVDEFRSWQDRHEGKPSHEEGIQLVETPAHYLPVEEHKNILLIVASQGDCPQKLMGSGSGDRFIVRELLKEQTDYGEIVCFRTRDLRPGKEMDIEEYDQHCRRTFKFLKGTKKDYFQAIFPFQPQCFDILRRITQSYDRYGLPAARSGIHIAYEAITYNGLLSSTRLAVPSDLLRSETLEKGLRSEQFKSGHEAYTNVVEDLGHLPLDDEEKELARRIIGTLYLWGLVYPDPGRFMPADELAEATLAELEGLHPRDAVLDLLTRLKSDVPQVKYDKEKGARFEAGEGAADDQPHRVFATFKKKAKSDEDAQNAAWREGLFWDFKTLEGVGDGGLFDGYANRDKDNALQLPHTSPVKATPAGLKVQYGGEVVVADRWETSFGMPWPNKPEVHYRIVYLTSGATVPKSDLQDPRIAVCVPAALSEDTREASAEYVACNAMLKHYNDRDHPAKGAFRAWAKARRREAMTGLLSAQVSEYRRGAILTQKELGLPAAEYFLPVGKPAGKKKDDATVSLQKDRTKREESLAAKLLEKAYDAPLFSPGELKKPLTDADARKVFHGLFAKAPSAADTSARDNFAAGLGLVAKKDPRQFAPQPGSAVLRVLDRVKFARDLSVADVIKELGQPPHGLTGDLARLALLCAVRAGTPPLLIAELNPSAGFKFANDKEPPGKRLTGKQIGQVEWSPKLEKALLGARIKVSDEKSFNEVLEYARVVDPVITPAHGVDDEADRNQELIARLRTLAEDLEKIHELLKKLARKLDGQVDDATAETFQRLTNIAATGDFQEFHEVARANYPTPEGFQQAYKVFDRARRLTDRYADLQSTRDYMDELAHLEESGLAGQAQLLKAQLTFSALWGGDESKVSSLLEQFLGFRDRYSLAYRKAHRSHHEAREAIEKSLSELEDELTVIERLNGLELGGPVGEKLADEVRVLAQRVHPCALKDASHAFEDARCPDCKWDGQTRPPEAEAQMLREKVAETAGDLRKRVSQEAIRKILESSGEKSVQTLLDRVTAARIPELAKILTPEMVARVRKILAAANVEVRSLALTDLIEGYAVLEEEQIDDLLKRLRERLRKQFDEAKRSTEGRKRIRFMLQ
jgi:hypothetical protein